VRVEFLHFQPESVRAAEILAALARTAGIMGLKPQMTRGYSGRSDLLVLWGPGGTDRFEPMRRQIAQGGHVLALDLAYWQREDKFRIAIDAAHPQAWVMRQTCRPDRLAADRVRVADLWHPSGPVIVAGIGEKAGLQYGVETVRAWEREQIHDAQARGWRVLYRPKKPDGYVPSGVPVAPHGDIERVLAGARLVVTWHSNVAVDAIRLGIPVVCRDGAAAAVYPSAIHEQPAPLDRAIRSAFLSNLSYFQWRPREAAACWRFVLELVA
jgi:hypothetical protein